MKQKDYFLTAAEHHFFKALLLALEGNLTVCPKVRLGDLFYVPKRMENIATANSLDRRHVDFVLCTPTNMNHCLGIELDDRSHETDKAKKRDEIVEKFFADAGLPLLRVRARAAYDPPVLALQIEAALKGGEISEEPAEEPTPVPLCPKCGVPMVLRVAGKGDHAGKPFYGCVNYPRCWAKVESLEG